MTSSLYVRPWRRRAMLSKILVQKYIYIPDYKISLASFVLYFHFLLIICFISIRSFLFCKLLLASKIQSLGSCSFQNILTNPIISQINTLLLPYFISYYSSAFTILISSTTTTPKCTLHSVLLYTDYLWNKGVYTVLETCFASSGDTENSYYTRHQGTEKRRDATLSSNRTLILAIRKKWQTFPSGKTHPENKNDEISSK